MRPRPCHGRLRRHPAGRPRHDRLRRPAPPYRQRPPVVLADDGQQALQVFEEHSVAGTPLDLVLLDMQMPRLDGYSTAQRLRSLGYVNPIIALTADVLAGDRERSMQAGCNAYLCKPIDRRELLATVARLVERAVSATP